MTDSSVPPALGIEGVECIVSEGADTITVRVTGRWRRRPTWSGQPLLVLEARGQRHRFPAMPEPPSLTGAAPGTWRMSFSVPASLAPEIGTRGWLQLGAVVVPLPIELEHRAPELPEPPEAGQGGERLVHSPSPELARQAARRRSPEAEDRAAELALRLQQLEHELEQARSEPARLAAVLDEEQRASRLAQQDAHAERMRRVELQEEHARHRREQGEADAVRADLLAARERIRELGRERAQLRRQLDEAEQQVAIARADRDSGDRWRAGGIRAEIEVASRAPPAARWPGLAAAMWTEPGRALLQGERKVTATRPSQSTLAASREEVSRLRAMIERERAARAEAQAHSARLEQDVHHYAVRSARAFGAIDELRREIAAVRAALADIREPSDVPSAEPATTPAEASDPEQRQPEQPEQPAGPVDAARLEAALSRLREAAPALAPEPLEPSAPSELPAADKPWIRPVFRSIVKRDPAGAGRLAIALLPAQPLVQPLPLAYDLVLSDLGCVAVTAAGGKAQVELRDLPRRREEVQLQVCGELSSLARLLAAGPVRRRLRRGLARPKGDRSTLKAMRGLVRAPLSLEQLRAAGVRPQPTLALSLVAAMVDPDWTKGESFTIAHREPDVALPRACLRVRDGGPVVVVDPAACGTGGVDGIAQAGGLRGPGGLGGAISTTVLCPADSLLAVFDVAISADVVIEGDTRPLSVVQSWIKRAQSG